MGQAYILRTVSIIRDGLEVFVLTFYLIKHSNTNHQIVFESVSLGSSGLPIKAEDLMAEIVLAIAEKANQ